MTEQSSPSRDQKLAMAKEKLHKFQKHRSKENSFILESAVSGTKVNGQQLSSLLSSNGSSAGDAVGSDSRSNPPNPNPAATTGVLSPDSDSDGYTSVLAGLENFHITIPNDTPVDKNEALSSGLRSASTITSSYTARDGFGSPISQTTRIAELKAQNAKLNERISLMDAVIEDLKTNSAHTMQNGSLGLIDAEKVYQLTEDLALAQSERDVLEEQLNIVIKQLADTSNTLAEADTGDSDEIASLQLKLQEYQEMIASLQQDAESAQNAIKELTEAKKMLEEEIIVQPSPRAGAQVSHLQKALEEHRETEKRLRNQLAAIICQVDKSEDTDAFNHQEIYRLRALVDSLANQLSTLQLRLETVERHAAEEVSNLLGKIAALEDELDHANNFDQSDPLQARIIHYRCEVESLRRENQLLRDQRAHFEELEERLQASEDRSSLIEELRFQIKSQDLEMENFRQQAMRGQQVDDLKMAQLQRQRVEQSQLLERLQNSEKVDSLKSPDSAEAQTLRETLSTIESEHTKVVFSLTNEINDLRLNAHIGPSQDMEELQAINDAQSLEIQVAQIDIQNLKNEIETLKQENSISQIQDSQTIKKQRMELEACNLTISELEGKSRFDLQRQNNHHQKEVEQLRVQLKKRSETSEEFEILQQKIKDLEGENSGVYKMLETERASHILALEQASAALLIKDTKSRVTFRGEESRKIEILERENAQNKSEISSLLAELEETSSEKGKKSMQMDLDQAREEIATLKSIISLKPKSLTINGPSLLKEIETLRESYETQLKFMTESVSQSKNIILQKSEDIKALTQEISQLKSSLNDSSILIETMQRLKEQNSELKFQFKSNDIDDKTAELLSKLENELKDEQDRTLELETVIESNGVNFEKAVEEYEKQIEDLNLEISRLEKISSIPSPYDPITFKEQLDESEGRVIELEAIIESNMSQYEQMIDDHENTIAKHESEVKLLQEARSEALIKCGELKQLVEEKDGDILRLITVQKSLSTERDEIQLRLRELEARLEEVTAENDQSIISNHGNSFRNYGSSDNEDPFADVEAAGLDTIVELRALVELKSEYLERAQNECKNWELEVESLRESHKQAEEKIIELDAYIETTLVYYNGLLKSEAVEKNQLESKIQLLEASHAPNIVNGHPQVVPEEQQGGYTNGQPLNTFDNPSQSAFDGILQNVNDREGEYNYAGQSQPEYDGQARTECDMTSSNAVDTNAQFDAFDSESNPTSRNAFEEQSYSVFEEQSNNAFDKQSNMGVDRQNAFDSDSQSRNAFDVQSHNDFENHSNTQFDAEKIRELQSLVDQLRLELKSAYTNNDEELQFSKEEMSKMTEELQNVRDELNEARDYSQKVLENEIRSLKVDSEELKIQNEVLRSQNGELEESNRKVGQAKAAELEEVLSELNDLRLSVESLRSELFVAQTAVAAWEAYSSKALAEQEIYFRQQIEQGAYPALEGDREPSQDILGEGNLEEKLAEKELAPGDDKLNIPRSPDIEELQDRVDKANLELKTVIDQLDEKSNEAKSLYEQLSAQCAYCETLDKSIAEVFELVNWGSVSADTSPEKLAVISRIIYEKQDVFQEVISLDISQRNAEFSEMEAKYQEAISKIEEITEGKKLIDDQVQSLRQSLEVKEERLQALSDANLDLETQMKERVTDVTKELQNRLDEEIVAKNMLESEVHDLQTRIQETQIKFQDSESKAKDAALIIEEWQQYAAPLESKMAELEAHIEKLNLEIADSSSKMRNLKENEDSLKNELEDVKARNQSVHEVKEALKSAMFDLDQKMNVISDLEASLSGVQARFEIVNSEKVQFQRELNDKDFELQGVVEKSKNAERNVAGESEKRAQLQEYISQLEQERDANNISFEAERTGAHEKIREFETYIGSLQQERSELLVQFDNANKESFQVLQERDKCISDIQAELISLNNQLSTAYELEASARSQLDEAVALSEKKDYTISELQSKLDASDSTISQTKEDFDELALLYQETMREVETLKTRISTSLFTSGAQEPLNISSSERIALNNLISALEVENKAVSQEVKQLKRLSETNDLLKEEVQALQDKVKASERKGLEIAKLEDHIFELQEKNREEDRDLQKARYELIQSEDRVRSIEIERNNLVIENNRAQDLMEMHFMAEQQKLKEAHNFRTNEIKAGLEATIEEILRKNNHMQQILDETEKMMMDERIIHKQREQALADDIRFHSPRNDFAQDFAEMNNQLDSLTAENRRFQRLLDSQANDFLRERDDLLGEISMLKQNLEIMERNNNENDFNRIIQKLQAQKNELEFQLSEKQELLARFNPQYLTDQRAENQKLALEKILASKEEELLNAEMRINHLINERQEAIEEATTAVQNESERGNRLAFKVQDLSLLNKQLLEEIDLLRGDIPNDFSNLRVFNSQILVILEELFDQTIGEKYFGSSKGIAIIKNQSEMLIDEVLHLRQFTAKQVIWRSDLIFQKQYLCLKVDDLEESANSLLIFLKKKGIKLPGDTLEKKLLPRQRWKRVIIGIIAIHRLMRLEQQSHDLYRF